MNITVEPLIDDPLIKGHSIKYLPTMDKTKSPNFILSINLMQLEKTISIQGTNYLSPKVSVAQRFHSKCVCFTKNQNKFSCLTNYLAGFANSATS